ncbi:glycoside hydrolase family 2 TIM barrel-domain containing protein [Wenyingzhuangia sp. chi5]|uniref:Glycoside hydrolase family 2 TIM barrel-domain containing protein n=1 Tax=Wenyingzhuangia gilva TaxID=3057677 RepID=A0ABT8VTX1_9FLAO|nr:glycoside hydrolase family 2 TIM barrel-domain containing protein [Wenyingzhuangia sp. chi5]MDO3695412.1 glycoside hydrolase family 2 TIM barrel-domain containing protein [Wenyingzhuangia sp. chi5]
MTLSIHKNILKTTLIVIYISVTLLVIFGLSAVFTYLNTGADRNLMLHNKIHETVHYQPKITWDISHVEGREITQTALQNIEKDYLNAWYVKQVAFEKNTQKGLKDYYTKSALETILKSIKANTDNHISIKGTSLDHHPSIDFFSEDGQLIVITDENIKEYKRIYKNETLLLETTEVNTYQFLLLLEDGFWRIRQILKIEPTKKADLQTTATSVSQQIKGINYYPQDSPWDMFGNDFDKKVINQDFNIIQKAGLNTIRIFIQYEDFGKSEVKPEKLEKLTSVLNLAQKNHLKVIITLFDFYGDYQVLDWTLNNQHATKIINHCKEHPALFAWDIKNEPNLDFESRGKEKVLAWLKQMIYRVKTIDKKHPVTIGWSNTKSATNLKDMVDFVSFHYYENLDQLEKAYLQLKKEIPNKEIVLGEYGLSSYRGIWNPFGNSEENQAEYHQKFQEIASKNKIPFVSWTLYDFKKIPKEVVGQLPWRKYNQKHFGFINQAGERKASFQYISKP